jgi:4-amino-4-deoxy-L-arabinose transferase-like glycosyltransferase
MIRTALASLLSLLSGVATLTFVGVAILRLDHPFELEWVEGFFVEIVARIRDGQGIYVEPSLDFISCIYTPLYFYVSAALSSVAGEGFAPLRAVSLLATLGSCGVLYAMAWRETQRHWPGWLAAGTFTAAFAASGAWYDLARVDSLFLFLLLLGMATLRWAGSQWGVAASALFVVLSFLTKQTALAIALPVAAWLLLADWRRGALWGGLIAAGVVSSTLAFDAASDGWYRFYVFEFQPQREFEAWKLTGFWTTDLLATVPVACAGALLLAWRTLRDPGGWGRFFFLAWAAATIVAVYLARAQSGGYLNNLMPAYALLALLLALAAHRETAVLAASRVRASPLEIGIFVACVLQLVHLAEDPRQWLPTPEDEAAGERLVEKISETPGDVLIVDQGYLATLAGKRSFAHGVMLWDIARSDRPELQQRLSREIETALGEKRFGAVVLSDGWFAVSPSLERTYEKDHRLFDSERFWPVTGARVRPSYWYRPRRDL